MLSVRFTRCIQRFQHWTRFKSNLSAASIDIGADGKKNDTGTKPDAAVDSATKVSCELFC